MWAAPSSEARTCLTHAGKPVFEQDLSKLVQAYGARLNNGLQFCVNNDQTEAIPGAPFRTMFRRCKLNGMVNDDLLQGRFPNTTRVVEDIKYSSR